jgi:hypothetical protein
MIALGPLAPYTAAMKLAALVSLVAIVALMGWRVSAWHEAYSAIGPLRKQLTVETSCGEGSACRAREAKLREELVREKAEVVAGLESELAAVRGRPARVVRVCPGAGDVPVSGAAGRGHGAPAGPGIIPVPAGPDIGPDLYALAREADEVTARCRALQQWNRALAAE